MSNRRNPIEFGLVCAIVWFATGMVSDVLASEREATSAESNNLADPLFQEIHLVQLSKLPTYGYRGLGDIEVLADGRLLAVYSDASEIPVGGIAAKTSTDKGKTWSREYALLAPPKPADPDRPTRYVHPGLQRLANGHLILTYPYTTQVRPYHYAQTLCRRSTDGGATWGDQFSITPATPPNVGHNDKLVQLSSGRLVLPVEHETDLDDDHKGYESYVFLSDDNGYSWRKSNGVVNMLPIEAQEPHVVELKDGRLLMLLRTYEQCLGKSYSNDQGETWSQGELIPDLKLSPNASAINVKRIPATGDLLLLRSTGGEEGRRTPFVAVISKDDGATWENERVIAGDPADDYGYPSLTFVDDLALVFYHKRDGFYLARIDTKWFYEASQSDDKPAQSDGEG